LFPNEQKNTGWVRPRIDFPIPDALFVVNKERRSPGGLLFHFQFSADHAHSKRITSAPANCGNQALDYRLTINSSRPVALAGLCRDPVVRE
jgi:hypothetical protein